MECKDTVPEVAETIDVVLSLNLHLPESDR